MGEEAGEGGKAHLVGIPGRTAAAWRSFPDCPSWNPHPGLLSVLEGEAQTMRLVAAAAFADQWLFLVVGYILMVGLHEVGNWIAQSTDWVARVASVPVGPPCDPKHEVAKGGAGPWEASCRLPGPSGLLPRGFHSTQQDVLGLDT